MRQSSNSSATSKKTAHRWRSHAQIAIKFFQDKISESQITNATSKRTCLLQIIKSNLFQLRLKQSLINIRSKTRSWKEKLRIKRYRSLFWRPKRHTENFKNPRQNSKRNISKKRSPLWKLRLRWRKLEKKFQPKKYPHQKKGHLFKFHLLRCKLSQEFSHPSSHVSEMGWNLLKMIPKRKDPSAVVTAVTVHAAANPAVNAIAARIKIANAPRKRIAAQ